MIRVFAETVDKTLVPLQILMYFPLTSVAPVDNTEYCRRTQLQFIGQDNTEKTTLKLLSCKMATCLLKRNSSDFD